MKKLALLLMMAGVLSTASAKFYFGFPGSTVVTSGGARSLASFQMGNYGVTPNFGVRVLVESNLGFNDSSILQGGFDLMFTTGEYNTFYLGGGAGYINISIDAQELNALYLAPVLGIDFDSGSTVSLFIEATPRVYFYGRSEILLYVRSGINFHLGLPRPEPQVVPAATTGTEAPKQPSVDENGNRYLEPWVETP
jgi:hypothetical protein